MSRAKADAGSAMVNLRLIQLLVLYLLFCIGASGCAPQGFEEVEEDSAAVDGGKADSMRGPLTIVEIADGFVEIRNDGSEPVDLDGWFLSFSRRRVELVPRGASDSIVDPGGLVVIADISESLPTPAPAWTPSVGTSKNLRELLAHSKSLILRTPDKAVSDRIDARGFGSKVSLERRLKTRVAVSPVGPTPGERNFIHDASAVQMHFSDPLIQDENPLPHELARFIASANDTVDAALYQIDHPVVIDALVAAADRKVVVRLATDTTYLNHEDYVAGYTALIAAGVDVVGDERGGRQHNKFIVVDGRALLMGSYNPLDEGSHFLATDNVVEIESRRLATIFTDELDEMFAGKFGPKKTDSGDHVAFVDGAQVEAYFSPTDGIRDVVIQQLARAETSIYFSSFSFFMSEIASVMIGRHQAGVDVRGAVDRRSSGTNSQFDELAAGGIDVRRPYDNRLLHHKFVIIDHGGTDPVVITGSYNLSSKAESQNDESVVVIHDRRLVNEYFDLWQRIHTSCSGPNQ